MAERAYKRRRILVDRLQLQLLTITLLYFAVTAAVFAVAIFAPLVWQLNVEGPGVEQAGAASEFLSLHKRFWPALLATFALLSAHAILTSHRIAGPLYRFRAVFEEIGDGNLALWVGLRRRDLLLKEAEALNRMILGLREGVQRVARHEREASRCAAGLERALGASPGGETAAQLANLQEALALLEQQLKHFKVDHGGSDDGEA